MESDLGVCARRPLGTPTALSCCLPQAQGSSEGSQAKLHQEPRPLRRVAPHEKIQTLNSHLASEQRNPQRLSEGREWGSILASGQGRLLTCLPLSGRTRELLPGTLRGALAFTQFSNSELPRVTSVGTFLSHLQPYRGPLPPSRCPPSVPAGCEAEWGGQVSSAPFCLQVASSPVKGGAAECENARRGVRDPQLCAKSAKVEDKSMAPA